IYLLKCLTEAAYDRMTDLPMFWAVLGPIYDALNPLDPEGFKDTIRQGEDWLLLSRQEDDERLETFDAMLEYVERAPGPELEAFFEALDNVDSDSSAPGRSLPDPEKLWITIVKRTQ